MMKKILYSLHRVLGCILCLLFLVWFLSGFVMIYHTFPRVSNMDKYAYMDHLSQKITPVDSIIETLPENNIFLKFSLKSYAGNVFYEGMSMDGIVRFSAEDTTFEKTELIPSYEEIEHYAKKWNTSEIVKVDTLRELEQWIPFSYLQKDFPIYKFYFGDKDKHQLYLSSQTGEALQFTNNDSRFWAWLGPIPHWVYFTSLRQNSQLWADTVIWLSGIGCIMCIAGIIMGIRSFIVRRQRKKKWETPYRKFVYKWHHILGFFFGIFVFTFVFSGMMSLANIPNWMIKVHNTSIQENMFLPQPIDFKNYKLDAQRIIESYPEEVKSIEWSSFGQKPLYKIIVGTKQLTIDASTDSLRILDLSETDIRSNLSQTHSEPMKISLMTEYDNYYVGLTDHLPLPVYKVEVADADNSTYYINPKNASIRYFNTNSKAHKWTYQALHSYKFSFLAKHPVLWNIVMWTSMIGGTLVSITGVWLGIRYFIRKIKKGKKYLYTKKKKD